MPKANCAVGAEQQLLSDVVTISRQFLRSVRLDTDLGREDALSGYICQGSARSLLENMARQIVETNQRAFTWTGPYGGGKSCFGALLFSERADKRAKAKLALGLTDGSLIQRAFNTKDKADGWSCPSSASVRKSALN